MATITHKGSRAKKRRHAPKPTTLKNERLRRQDPARTGPIRNATTYLRDSRSWGGRTPGSTRPDAQKHTQGSTGSVDDVVTRGVKLGYKVIEDYLRQGQHTAAQTRKVSEKKESSKVGEREEILESVLRFYKDMTDLWIDGVGGIVRNPAFTSWLNGAVQRNGAAAPSREKEPGSVNGADGALAIEIVSKRRTQVTLDLRPYPGRYTPLVCALHAPNPKIPPLTKIAFRLDQRSRSPILQLKVPGRQPAALYTGVVIDKHTHEPRGTLCVRVLP